MANVFVNAAGQPDNLGDVVLRRRFLDSLRPLGRLHLFLGGATSSYTAGLTDGTEQLYYNAADWREATVDSASSTRTFYVLQTGELVLRPQILRRLLLDRRIVKRVKQSGGASFVLGLGTRQSPNLVQRFIARAAFREFDEVRWRDVRTFKKIKVGSVMPDWAFGFGGDTVADARDRVVVSMRHDRPLPSPEWCAAVRRFAEEEELRITVVRQVGRDKERCDRLASELQAEQGPWIDGDFAATEAALRDLYRRTRLALSDRLHVLIIAATEGAVPVCWVDHAEDKIGRHFDTIGYFGASESPAGLDVEDRLARLRAHLNREFEIRSAVRTARHDILAVEQRLRDFSIGTEPACR